MQSSEFCLFAFSEPSRYDIIAINVDVVSRMNQLKLSKRLRTISDHLLRGKVLADIGSDHAYLPCYACLTGIVPSAIAGELNDGPFLTAKQQVENAGLASVISVRKGDGLTVIKCNEAEQITIAGMGGSLIAGILQQGKDRLTGVARLVLQPNVATHQVRRWLYANEWKLITEEILEEDRNFYEVLVAEPGRDHELYSEGREAAFLFGPFLMKEKTDVFQRKWAMEMEKKERILSSLKNANRSEKTEMKKKQLEAKLRMIKEAIM